MSEFELVTLTDAYIDDMMAIETTSFSAPWSRQSYVNEFTKNPLAYYIGCVSGGSLWGYAGVWLILDEGHISNVAVHPKKRGQGIGEAMLRLLMANCMKRGCMTMTLEVRTSNLAAIHLYEKLGFRPTGRRPHYYSDNGEDALIYWVSMGEKA